MRRQGRKLIAGTIVFIFSLCFFSLAFAADGKEEAKAEPKTTKKVQEVQGKITWISKNKIAIAYKQDKSTEYEILLPFDSQEITLEHKNKLSEIGVGDTVKVQYEEESIEYPDGKKEGKLKAKVISFISPKAKEALIGKSVDQSQQETLTLKGIK